MNSVNLTGRLVNDPSRRDTHRGVVATFRLAVDGRPRMWIDVETWGHLAGTVATYLRARRHVAVTGRLAYHEYHDRTGHKQAAFRVIADRIEFLESPAVGGDTSQPLAGPRATSERDQPTNASDYGLHDAS
jgi:single-strand DNA-binding protein